VTDSIVSAQGWTWGQLALAAALVALVLWQGYRWMIVPLPARYRAALLGLRLFWTLLLLWCLWEPAVQKVWEEVRERAPRATVLVDCSRSMSLPDEQDRSRWQLVEAMLPELESLLDRSPASDPVWIRMGEGLRQWTPADGRLVADEPESRIWEGVRETFRRRADPNRAGILFLLTDGADTGSEQLRDLLPAVANQGLRVYPVRLDDGIGLPPIIRIDQLTAPEEVRVNERFAVAAEIRIRRSRATPLTASLSCAGKPLGEQQLVATSDGTCRVEFPVLATEPGLRTYRLELRDAAGPLASRTRTVHARDKQERRVLYVMGSLDWEYQYVCRAVAENPSFALDTLVRKTPARYDWIVGDQPARSGGLELLQEAIQAAATRYDAVVLANLNPRQLAGPEQEALLRLVRDSGGGILFMNGNPAQAAEFRGSLLEELLPISFAPAEPPPTPDEAEEMVRSLLTEGAPNPVSEYYYVAAQDRLDPLGTRLAMQLTPAGRESRFWQNALTGRRLGDPPATFIGSARVGGVKPAAEVLAVHPELKLAGEPLPLLVSQTVGAGRSVYLGIDALWPWRMEARSEDRDYDVFWQQLLNWLCANSTASPAEMALELGRLEPGGAARVVVRSRSRGEPVSLWLAAGDRPEEEIPLGWNPAGTEADGQFVPPSDLDFTVLARGAEGVLAHRCGFVGTAELERERAGFQEADLESLARETGGRVLEPGEIPGFAAALEPWKQTFTRKDIRPLWHSPWIFAALLGAYAAELLLRRRWHVT
jgi:hypothetical protein